MSQKPQCPQNIATAWACSLPLRGKRHHVCECARAGDGTHCVSELLCVCVCVYIYISICVCARARIRAPLMSPGGREVSLTRDVGSLGRSLDS